MRIGLLIALILPLCSAAPLEIASLDKNVDGEADYVHDGTHNVYIQMEGNIIISGSVHSHDLSFGHQVNLHGHDSHSQDTPTPATTPSSPFPYYIDEATKISAATTASPTDEATKTSAANTASPTDEATKISSATTASPTDEATKISAANTASPTGISKQQAIKALIGTREKIHKWQCGLMHPNMKKNKLKNDQEEKLIDRMTKATAILQKHDYCRIENGNCEPEQMETFNSYISKADDLVNNYIRVPSEDINGEYTVRVSPWLLEEFQEKKKTFDEATVQEIQKLMPESSRVCIPGEISSAACVCRSASIYREYEDHCTANQGCTPHGFCFTVCNRESCTCANFALPRGRSFPPFPPEKGNCANGQICINGKCLNVCQGEIRSECICPDARGFHEYGGEQCPPKGEEGNEKKIQYLCGCSGCVPVIGWFFFG